MGVMNRDEFEGVFAATNPNWVGGDAESFSFGIEQIRLRSGDIIRPQLAGVTAIVGANNAGKSTILREVMETLQHHPNNPKPPKLAVESVTLAAQGTEADFFAWLLGNATFAMQGQTYGFARPMASFEAPSNAAYLWAQRHQGIGNLAGFLCFYGNAAGRFAVGGSAEMRESIDDPPSHPVHALQDSAALRARVSDLSQEVFQHPLTLDALARTVRLRVGKVGLVPPPVDNIPRDYRDAMASLRPLDEQGDGMRGFFGQVLPVIAATYPVIILDEPEAFLHPPQAHALGVALGKIAVERGVQILIATHDRNMLTGLLDSDVDVSVVRASRGTGQSRAFQLDASRLRDLWNDPVLRYSNVLDGLFHRVVVLGEAEGDCAFLEAALDCPGRPITIPSGEVLFVATGGKAGMAKVASALKALEVPLVAAPDLDMLKDETELAQLARSLGMDWSSSGGDLWKRATAAQRVPTEPAKVAHVLQAITAALAPKSDEAYTPEIQEIVRAHLRSSGSPWNDVKRYGVDAFKGNARADLLGLLDLLESHGIVMVRYGELERLAPDVNARKGPGWLQAALGAGAQCNERSQEHVDRILRVGTQLLDAQTSL